MQHYGAVNNQQDSNGSPVDRPWIVQSENEEVQVPFLNSTNSAQVYIQPAIYISARVISYLG